MKHFKLATCVITTLLSLTISSTTLATYPPNCPSAADLTHAYIQYVYPNDWAPELWNATGKLNFNGVSWDVEINYLTKKNDTDAFKQAQSAITSITATPPYQSNYDDDIECSYHTTIDPHIIITVDYES